MASVAVPGVPPSVRGLAGRLSPRAQAAMGTWRWHVDEEKRHSREELARRLAEKGAPEWPCLWPVEEALAGVEVRLGGFDLEIGIAANLPHFDREELVDEHDRIRFVPAGYWGIYTLFLDEAGRLYLFHVPDELVPLEPSFESFFEQQAMMASFRVWAPHGFAADLSPGNLAPRLAAERAIPLVAEASNEFHRWWQDDAWTLFEPASGGVATVWAKTLGDLVSALDTAARIEPTFEARPRPPASPAHIEELPAGEVAARAPSLETLRSWPGARRVALLGQPSIHEGKPPSSGDVWISGEGETLRMDVLERCGDELRSCWQLTPGGSHALFTSRYARGQVS